ncbi:hypothetical protein BDV19DRAFT_362801 [Aspergillus venezuelensis]
MAWYSILPAELERWVVRCFLFLGVFTVLPWLTLLVFDMALYLWRLVTYYIPGVGGRARGRQRPRAPSLNELPDRFGLSATASVNTPNTNVKSDRTTEREVDRGVDQKENIGGATSSPARNGERVLRRRGGR